MEKITTLCLIILLTYLLLQHYFFNDFTKELKKLASRGGFEPPTHDLTDRCANPCATQTLWEISLHSLRRKTFHTSNAYPLRKIEIPSKKEKYPLGPFSFFSVFPFLFFFFTFHGLRSVYLSHPVA